MFCPWDGDVYYEIFQYFNAIYTLRETVGLFDELSSLFAADSNSQVSREVLDKVSIATGSSLYALIFEGLIYHELLNNLNP